MIVAIMVGIATVLVSAVLVFQDPHWSSYARMRRAADRDWRRHQLAERELEALPEPEADTARARELAAWNDPRTWRGCSDYPPPSSVKLRERD